jgi:hypothetical protein
MIKFYETHAVMFMVLTFLLFIIGGIAQCQPIVLAGMIVTIIQLIFAFTAILRDM